ncbi:AT-rich interactive domain-containing protein 2-like [Pollicipes pollicipes]|uniref:AT-rich interactive domain-containing protein 2-like n=1 Tax=Pollicipes pollicipes TaxID=41117 RepID=UPI0018857D41|nr:AT-rich interactive domain-containing protein 2-like [Pollicipes pollicipes]
MAQLLNKDPAVYKKEAEAFFSDLKGFHGGRGTAFHRTPKIGGRDVDLYLLYVLVTTRGGWEKVNDYNEWDTLAPLFEMPVACVNVGLALKQIYLRYLDHYEKVHFHGEELYGRHDEEMILHDTSSRSSRRHNVRALNAVPMTYNTGQHIVSDSLRQSLGMSQPRPPSEYDRLLLSLLSPLPNEQDFAINLCTLLSNEGKHELRLSRHPRLMGALLAHAGVFTDGYTQKYMLENYSRTKRQNLVAFWRDSLTEKKLLRLLSVHYAPERRPLTGPAGAHDSALLFSPARAELHQLDAEVAALAAAGAAADDDDALFCLGTQLGVLERTGHRVLQVAQVLRSLSFEPENAAVMAASAACLRFLLLCAHCRWGSLSSSARDTLGNLAGEVVLRDAASDRLGRLLVQYAGRGVQHADRSVVLASLEVLNKLAQNERNEEPLAAALDARLLQTVCTYLSLHDILLLIASLECLLGLTSLGEDTCRAVARAPGAVTTLVSLVTVEAQSYGPRACILMKVMQTPCSVPAPAAAVSPAAAVTVLTWQGPLSHVASAPVTENSLWTVKWLQTVCEVSPGQSIEQGVLYKQYTASAAAQHWKGVITQGEFANCVKSVFGSSVNAVAKRLANGGTEYHFEGIRSKLQIVTTVVQPPQPEPAVATSQGPAGRHLSQALMGGPGHQRPEPAAASSSLIKSLLASKVPPHPPQQQQHQQQPQESAPAVSASPTGGLSPSCFSTPQAQVARNMQNKRLAVNGVGETEPLPGELADPAAGGDGAVHNGIKPAPNSGSRPPSRAASEGLLADLLERKIAPVNGIDKELRIGERGLELVNNNNGSAGGDERTVNGGAASPAKRNGTDLLASALDMAGLMDDLGAMDDDDPPPASPPPPPAVVMVPQSMANMVLKLPANGAGTGNVVVGQPAVGQPQTVLVAQTPQQQGTATRTLIFLPPHQKVYVSQPGATHQGQLMVQVTRAMSGTTQVVNSTVVTGSRAAQQHLVAPTPESVGRPLPAGLLCEWRGCLRGFPTAHAVYQHAIETHCPPQLSDIPCLWERCDGMIRKRYSMMTHLQDRHCAEPMLRLMRKRREQLQATGKTDIPTPSAPPPHPGYANNAALQAIRRHALTEAKPPPDEKEGPVTKSIRLTAALILRNIAVFSQHGRRVLRAHESHLLNVAASSAESSRTIGQLLADLHEVDPS